MEIKSSIPTIYRVKLLISRMTKGNYALEKELNKHAKKSEVLKLTYVDIINEGTSNVSPIIYELSYQRVKKKAFNNWRNLYGSFWLIKK